MRARCKKEKNVSLGRCESKEEGAKKLPQAVEKRKVLAWGEMKVRKKVRKSYHKR